MQRQTLLTIYKSIVRPNLNYGDFIYDQPKNESFLAITGAIRATSQTKIYKELGLESLYKIQKII